MWDLEIDGKSLKPVVPAKAQQILRDQAIEEDGPGTILRDFAALLAFVGDAGLKTTGKYYFLPQGRLDELNERMSHPIVHRLKRPQQRSFPHLHGLYLLLRATGLGIGAGAPPNGRLILDEGMLALWHDLNPTERYFNLLESWLVHATCDIIAERSWGTSGECFESVSSVAQRLRKRRTEVSDARHDGPLYGMTDFMTAALMELFGWLRLECAQPEPGEGFNPAAIERLALGDAMLNVLIAAQFAGEWERYYDDQPAEPGVLQPVFQPYFPQWQRVLAQPETGFREGTFTWRVSLGSAWRRIVAPAASSLDELAGSILDAFDFDCDHLYCFQLRDRRGRELRIACPYEDDAAAFTDEVGLGDLPISEGASMKFIFDYGDWWEFTVRLEEIGPTDPKLTGPKVTAKKGRAPEQYRWED